MYQIRRRSYNITYQENRRNSSSASSEAQSSDEQITNESDTEKLNAELLKELKKKDVNNKAVAELQRLLLGMFFTQKFQHEKFEKNTCK